MKESKSEIILLSVLMMLFALAVGGMGGRLEKSDVSVEKDTIFNKWRRIY
jgi:hypothetical protein